MPKKYLQPCVCVVIACFLLMTGTAIAASRFESGFRGVAWGTHKDRLPHLGLSKKALKNIYKKGPSSVIFMEGKGNLAMDFDGIPLLSIFLHFHDQVFCGADLIFKYADREFIYTIITTEMKSDGLPDAEGHRWQTAHLDILLTDRELMITHKDRQ